MRPARSASTRATVGCPNKLLVALLLSVQAMEFAWVASNYLGLEHTTTEPIVQYVDGSARC